MKLRYKALTQDGKKIRGFIEAKDKTEASNYLHQKNLIPVQIIEDKQQDLVNKLPFSGHVKSGDLVLFTRQLSSMLSSGLTLIKSLEILKDQISNKTLREVIGGCLLDLQEGKTFSQSISKYPDIFSNVYVSLVKAGEDSGVLDKVFMRLAINLEKQHKLKNKVKGALMYPIIVITLMIVVTFVLMIAVIPQLKELYDGLGVELPTATKIVVGMSEFVGRVWPFLIGIVIASIYAFMRWKKTPKGKQIYDTYKLKLPLFGKIVRQSILTEFTRTFGLLAGTGTLIVDALDESAFVTGNLVYESAINTVSKKVEKGIPIGEAFESNPVFPPLLVQLVKVGEETGKLDENLLKASDYFEDEVNQAVKTLTTAMEPIIMIVLGIGVGFLVFSVISPIYGLLEAVG